MPFFGPRLRIEAGRRGGIGDDFGEFGEYFGTILRRGFADPGVFPMGRAARAPRPYEGVPAPIIVPTVAVLPPPPAEESVDIASAGPPTVDLSETVIDPDFAPRYVVSEAEVRGPLIEPPNPFQETAPTDWDAVYDEYVELNPEVEEVAVDWGDILGTALGGIAGGLFDPVGLGKFTQNQLQGTMVSAIAPMSQELPAYGVTGVSGGTPMAANGCPPTGPRYAKVCLATGAVTPLRRRRRRRLLTSSDLADLASLKAIVGGGAAMNSAVVKAVRR